MDTKAEYPTNFIHQLFERRVKQNPHAIAIKFESQYLTYGQLDTRANQVAHHIRTLGVGPDCLVGLCLDRSIDLLVGILGVLKAGGAYVPLDPSYPNQRLAFMLRDAEATVVLTQQHLTKILPPLSAHVVCLDQDLHLISKAPHDAPVNALMPHNAAYVIYTSGSTGSPKGVIVTHANVTRLFQATQAWFHFDQHDTWTLFHSYAFDFSVWEIWGALAYGGTLVIVPYLVSRSPRLFLELLARDKVTVLNQTPSAFRELISAEQEQAIAQGLRLRLVIFGGEALNFRILKPWFEKHGDQLPRLVNMYGITETTVHVTYRPIVEDDITTESGSLIGLPIPDLEVYVLHPNQTTPVPVGEPGELCIGGAGVTRGYLNRPELTAERFIDDPFSGRAGARLYRSGDLARFLPNGDLEYLGRIDEQVKISGFRIELGEIETVLLKHPKVKAAVVLTRDGNLPEQRLVAYIVSNQHPAPTVDEVRSHLKERIPNYMIPAAFVFLASLPLTINGKIDRSALPVPDCDRPRLEGEYLAPRSHAEEQITEIWTEVLGLKPIGIRDDFFMLGGDSLRAIQIVTRLRKVLNKEIFPNDIFSNPTIEELTHKLNQNTIEPGAQVTIPIHTISRDHPLPLSFSQERAWFVQQLHPSSLAYHSQSLLHFTGSLNISALEGALTEIVRRHEIYRTTFPDIDGHPVQAVHAPFLVSLPIFDIQNLSVHEREAALQRRITEETQKPFNLSTLPLVRWTLVKLQPTEFVLIHVENHLIHDGWSFNVFRGELMDLYRAFSCGEASPLPEPSIQFADFAQWQRQWMEGPAAKHQLSYWTEQLKSSPPFLDLAADHRRPLVPSFRGAAPRFAISASVANALRDLSRERGVTLFMTMLAAFLTLLYRYTGQEDICIGTGVANRRWRESEGLIGMLVNNVVLRNHISGELKFVDLLAQVRTVTLDAFANEDIPFDHVVRAMHLERDLGRNPLFQAMFSFHDSPLHEAIPPGMTVKCVEAISNGSAKFDIDIVVIPQSVQIPTTPGVQEGLTVIWEYNSDLFNATTIKRMIGHFETLLEAIIVDPNQRVGDMPLLTKDERRQVLTQWNDTAGEFPTDKCIHNLFEEQSEKTPDAIALVLKDQQLTYRELNRRANQLGRYLRKLGVSQHTFVAIAMERGIEILVAVLGVLKAGAAYVPLAPDWPAERQDRILEETKATVLLTQAPFNEEKLATLTNSGAQGANRRRRFETIYLDADWEVISREDGENIETGATADDLAYVIYTSGSTGTPKGVMVRHGALVAHAFSAANHFSICDTDKVLQFASLSFDVAAEEIFPTWFRGAVVVLPPERLPPIADLVKFLIEERVTVGNLPAAYWHQWVEELDRLDAKIAPSLRLLIVGNEKVSLNHVKRWNQLVGKEVRLLNGYGPTEATVTTTIYEVPSEYEQLCDLTSLPLGRPMTNRQIFILDHNLQPVPVGVPGEICIGGPSLADGYLGDERLTREKFVGNPFHEVSGSRLYRTGDRGRYLPDGNVAFLGRSDDQVKIRGFRIELGEIETTLMNHPRIRGAAVVVREELGNENRLIAYVVLRSGDVRAMNQIANAAAPGEGHSRSVELWPSVGEYPIYDELLYDAMTYDQPRLAIYKAAIEKSVKGGTILDVGTGKDAVLARLCVEAGAKKVYAVEVMDKTYMQAQALVTKLGLQDKIHLLNGQLTQLQLSEKVDVCVSEIFGTIGGSEGAAVVLNSARRFLKHDGLMIPRTCNTKVAAITLPDEIHDQPRFSELTALYAEKVFQQVGYAFDLRVCIKNFPRSNILSDIEVFESLDFRELVPTNFSKDVTLKIAHSGRLDGFLLWLNLETMHQTSVDTLQEQTNWLPVFFPAFYPGLEVIEGDRIEMTCSGVLSDNGINPDYRLSGKVSREADVIVEFDFVSPHHQQPYKGTEFYGRLFDHDKLVRVTGQVSEITASTLTTYLSKRLPNYMIPSAFVFLDELPIAANGKVDRKALPNPGESPSLGKGTFIAPSSQVEILLAEIWATVLRVNKIGVHDNFFALGGHSLHATQVVSRIREIFKVEFPLRTLFEIPTVEDLSHIIEKLQAEMKECAF